ncbi:DUF6119 family protein [Ruegeria atlantica]|uniref:DUF6119 family protein n=1 Tax=Ruegeria atlantica TaxID=81569 RepID=UPI00147E197B|nr:DUF6119 family protein [Ruegeria atlantica]
MATAEDETKYVTLTARLLKPGRDIEGAFAADYAPGEPKAFEEKEWPRVDGARLFVGEAFSTPPGWLDFVTKASPQAASITKTTADGVEEERRLWVSGAAGILFVPVKDRTMAICFGHAHIPLNLEAFERRFGLKVTLNRVPRDKLRTLDVAVPDATSFQKRIQSSRDSDLSAFGVNVLRDIARVAGGTPEDKEFARFVAGKDSLSITCKVGPDDIETLCKKLMTAYNDKAYQSDFKWIDFLQPVDKTVAAELDDKLSEALQELRGGGANDLHLAPPEIVDYREGSKLHYNGFNGGSQDFFHLDIGDYCAQLDTAGFAGDISEIKEKHYIKSAKSGEEKLTKRWRIYDCFVFELEHQPAGEANAGRFALYGGDWYRIDSDYKDQIENGFNAIPKKSIIGPTTCENEEQLNELLKSRPEFVCLDKQKINPGGVRYANLEPCDFFSEDKQFIHVKDGHSSHSISHLWSQGFVSAEAFVNDGPFRGQLRQKVKKLKPGFEAHLPTARKKPDTSEYEIVYAIMRRPYADGTMSIPFFSKVSVHSSLEQLQNMGFKVAIDLVEKQEPVAAAA